MKPTSKYKYAMVCSSNVNRSVMAQIALTAKNMACDSYGVGTEVKLPGKSRDKPASFKFDQTSYLAMYDQLAKDDKELYTRNGVLQLLSRDAITKRHPERWQALSPETVATYDIVLCFENRITQHCSKQAYSAFLHAQHCLCITKCNALAHFTVIVIQYTYSDVHWIHKRISVAMHSDKNADDEVAMWHTTRPHRIYQ
eukprot:1632-Heterococcus_DN1.PRE.3